MKILVISDLHKNKSAAEQCSSIATNENTDLIVVVGDISHNDFDEAISLLKLIAQNKEVFFVPGNMDSRKLLNWTEDKIRNIHCKVMRIDDNLSFLGIGGSTRTPFNTSLEFDEEEVMSMLTETSKMLDVKRFILVSHCPPKNSIVDEINHGIHGGSVSIRKFVEKNSPLVNICGHIHEAKGIDKIGDTLIVNPGAVKDGHYAIIELNRVPKVILKSFY